MTRLIVFLSVLTAFIIGLVMFSYKSLPVSNEKFDLLKTEKSFHEREELVAHITAPKEKKSEEEVVVKEYAPVVDLSTPQLVNGHKLFNQCISCHGKGGEGKASQKAPFIGGQFDWYIEKQLTDMQAGTRVNVSMAVIVKGLSAQDMKDLAAYVSLLPWKKQEAAPAK